MIDYDYDRWDLDTLGSSWMRNQVIAQDLAWFWTQIAMAVLTEMLFEMRHWYFGELRFGIG